MSGSHWSQLKGLGLFTTLPSTPLGDIVLAARVTAIRVFYVVPFSFTFYLIQIIKTMKETLVLQCSQNLCD